MALNIVKFFTIFSLCFLRHNDYIGAADSAVKLKLECSDLKLDKFKRFCLTKVCSRVPNHDFEIEYLAGRILFVAARDKLFRGLITHLINGLTNSG